MSRGGCRARRRRVHGWNSRSALLVGRSHLAVSILRLAGQLAAWSLIKRRPWMHLFWDSAVDALRRLFLNISLRREKLEASVPAEFARRTRLKYRQTAARETFGFWLPTRRSAFNGVQAMATIWRKWPLPAPVLEETTLSISGSEPDRVCSVHACRTMVCARANGVLLCGGALAGIVPAEVLSRKTKQFAARTPALMLDQHWGEIQGAYSASISARLGYVDDEQLTENCRRHTRGKNVCPCARTLDDSLEFWYEIWRSGPAGFAAFSELAPTEGRCRCTPSPDPNDLPPVHSGRNFQPRKPP